MKRASMIISAAVLVMFLFTAIFIVSSASAQGRATAVPGAKFEVSFSIMENLKIYIGKDVLIHLRSGKTFQGYVKALGDQAVHLEKIAGKDFYDALIRIDDISAIEAKFRDMK